MQTTHVPKIDSVIVRSRDNDDETEYRFIVIIPSPSCHRSIVIIPSRHRTIPRTLSYHCHCYYDRSIIIAPSRHLSIHPDLDGAMVQSVLRGSIQIQCKQLKAYFINCMDSCAFTLKALKHKKAKKKNNNK